MEREGGRAPFSNGPAHLHRRAVLAGLAALGVSTAIPSRARAQEAESHGLSSFGDLTYPADFRHFGYVRPDAPKGGSFSFQIASLTGNQNFDTFNTLNVYVLKGDGAAGMPLTFDSLMVRALDETDAMYGLVARSVRADAERRVFRFRLRPEARFHDGSRLTARDVAFTVNLLREKGHPTLSQALRYVAGAEAEAEDVVRIDFAPERARDLPLLVAGLPIFSEAYWKTRDFEASTLEAPLGSGPYRVGRFEAGRFIAFERVKDYWAADLPVNVGQNNFDELRYEYFRDRQVAFEAFKGGVFTFREEFTARIWATGYDFPAAKDGRVTRETVQDRTPSGMQGWFFNQRRPKFADPRIREAIGLAFDFEAINRTIMYGAYARTASFFENSPYRAEGKPTPEELALLEPLRGKVPDEVFGEPFSPPKSDGSGQDRALLRRANTLLTEAGCKREGSVLKLPSGEPLAFEFLDFQQALQPHTLPFIANLGLLGIQATSRVVDAAQYQRRTEDFDFDVTTRRYSHAATPGESLRQVFGSRAAATRGSPNIAGISDPAIDTLIDAAVSAKSRPDLVAACRALDRVLRAGRNWVPMWYKASHTIAYWDMFGHPETPPYGLAAPETWWHDSDKARRIGRT
ncbi:extracellular solute-binding protein [Enterovirga rhinocerotis]|uniref:extracellular solute-binding protein n=1 Tax=Enterovirga rhinocerotis TaxID=1339210 RepID=UPI003CCAC00C